MSAYKKDAMIKLYLHIFFKINRFRDSEASLNRVTAFSQANTFA